MCVGRGVIVCVCVGKGVGLMCTKVRATVLLSRKHNHPQVSSLVSNRKHNHPQVPSLVSNRKQSSTRQPTVQVIQSETPAHLYQPFRERERDRERGGKSG